MSRAIVVTRGDTVRALRDELLSIVRTSTSDSTRVAAAAELRALICSDVAMSLNVPPAAFQSEDDGVTWGHVLTGADETVRLGTDETAKVSE